MAVNVQVAVESRRFSGWLDPRYPIGYWWASLEATGDATGGRLGIDLLFQPADPPRLNSQLYSVERFAALNDDGNLAIVAIQAINMGGPSNLGFSHKYAVDMPVLTGLTETAARPEAMQMLPWFLGSQRIAGISASLSLGSVNLDTVIFKFEAEGYRWSARSVLVDGGPQRPPTGPYGR